MKGRRARLRLYLRLHDGVEYLVDRVLFSRRLARVYRRWPGLPEAPVIVDVGAHRGESILFFRKHFPRARIHCFEPARDNFAALAEKFGGRPGITLNNVALGDRPGRPMFYRHITSSQSSLQKLNPEHWRARLAGAISGVAAGELITSSYPVEMRTLDDYLAERGIPVADIVKLDTEESEFECLAGCARALARQAIGLLQVESRETGGFVRRHSPEEIERFLAGFGYRPWARVRHLFPLHHVHEVFYRPEVRGRA